MVGRISFLLELAIERGDTAIVRLLLANGLPPSADSIVFALNVRDGAEPEIMELLLAYGADFNALDRKGRTPLLHALSVPDMTVWLLQNGADPNMDTAYGTVLDVVMDLFEITESPRVEEQSKAFLRVLLKHGADPDHRSTRGSTAAEVAMARGHADILQIFSDGRVKRRYVDPVSHEIPSGLVLP